MIYILTVCLMGTWDCSTKEKFFPNQEICETEGKRIVNKDLDTYPNASFVCKQKYKGDVFRENHAS